MVRMALRHIDCVQAAAGDTATRAVAGFLEDTLTVYLDEAGCHEALLESTQQ